MMHQPQDMLDFISDVMEKWPDRSSTSYAMLNFESEIENLDGKYLVI